MDDRSTQIVSQISSSVQTTASVVGAGVLGGQAIIGGTSNSLASSTNAVHLLLLLRYIDAGYPPNVESFFDMTSRNAPSNDSSIIPEVFLFVRVGNLSQYQSKWYRFGEYKLSVNFLTNCGTSVLICFFSLVMSGILMIVKKYAKRKSALVDNILYRFKWNQILSCVANNQSKLALGWFLQFSGTSFDAYGISNLIIAVLSLLGVAIVIVVPVNHTRWNWRVTRDKLFLSREAIKASEPRQKQYAFVVNDVVTETSVGRYFFVLSFAKVLLIVAIIFWLPKAPIAQIYLLLFTNIFFILALLIGKPYKELEKQLAMLSNEIIMLLQEVLMAVFATNKQVKFLSYTQWMVMGWIFIGLILLSLVVNAFVAIFIIIKALVISWRNKKKKSKRLRKRVSQSVIRTNILTPQGRIKKHSSRIVRNRNQFSTILGSSFSREIKSLKLKLHFIVACVESEQLHFKFSA